MQYIIYHAYRTQYENSLSHSYVRMRLYISNPKIIRKVSAWLGCCIIMIGNFTSQKHAVILMPAGFCNIIFLTGEDLGLGRNV